MYSKQVGFNPDSSVMRYAKKREEYQSRLVSRRPEAAFEASAEGEKKSGFVYDGDALLIGAIILSVISSKDERDYVLIGILLYVLLS